MDTQLIHQFLKDIAAKNDRQWFQDHKAAYEAARKSFEDGVAKAIGRIDDYE